MQSQRFFSWAVCLLVGMLGIAPQGLASTTPAPHGGPCGSLHSSCNTVIELASQTQGETSGVMHGSSPDGCPDCEMDGHCATCPSFSTADMGPDTYLIADSPTWESGLAASPVEIPTTPPERPPQS